MGIEHLDDLDEVGERAGQTLDHDHLDSPASISASMRFSAGRSKVAPENPPSSYMSGSARSALMHLTTDERLAGLPLGVKRVERL
jgi:hypothetical protein